MVEYINREEFIQHIEESDLPDMAKRAVIALVRHMPAADVVEVVHGEWEDVRESVSVMHYSGLPMTTTAETCTACRFRSCFVGPKVLLHDSICPNCGAKMDGERKETE